MSASKQYVRSDEHGVFRVGNTGVMLDSILAAWDQGASPEAIRRQFPSVSLEEIYGSIAWTLANEQTVLEYAQRQNVLWESLRSRSEASPLIQRLRAAMLNGAKQTGRT